MIMITVSMGAGMVTLPVITLGHLIPSVVVPSKLAPVWAPGSLPEA